MDVILKLSIEEEAKALPILLRHSRGEILPAGIYVVDASAAEALRAANVFYSLIQSKDKELP